MSIYTEYERDEWEGQGGWRGVKPSVDALTLLFRDDCEEDDLECEPETRTETPVESEPGLRCVTVTRDRYFRTFEREDEMTWWLVESGRRVFTERIYLGGGA